ncbi:unnamed protein product, partial [Nesidiocoris tenuis]
MVTVVQRPRATRPKRKPVAHVQTALKLLRSIKPNLSDDDVRLASQFLDTDRSKGCQTTKPIAAHSTTRGPRSIWPRFRTTTDRGQ